MYSALVYVGLWIFASSSSVQDDPEELIELWVLAHSNNVSLARKSLLGKVCTTKIFNKAAVNEIISKAWNIYPDLHISDLWRNMSFFSFVNEAHTKEGDDENSLVFHESLIVTP